MKYVLICILIFIRVDAFTQNDSLLWMSIASLLKGFPLKFQTSPYTPAQIALTRQWMFANKGKYKIRRDEF